jgi:hypothetical protein
MRDGIDENTRDGITKIEIVMVKKVVKNQSIPSKSI